MSSDRTIPIVVGITGHLALRPEDKDALYAAVKSELQKLRERCPHSELVMLTSLARGGDLLCADAAAELGLSLYVALPMEREEYEKDFSEADRARFDAHCRRAETVFVAPSAEEEPQTPDRDFYYRQAGIYVAAHSHVQLALWDGGAPSANGCGTAEAVDFALRGAYRPANGMALRSGENAAVIHVFTPRGENTAGTAGRTRLLGNERAFYGVLEQTDEFNRLATDASAAGQLLPETVEGDPVLTRLERLYHAADSLSVSFAATYRNVLALLAVASTVLTLAFLLYDEVDMIWMILVCGAMLVGAWLCRRFAARSDCHRRYIEYRALAEGLRVQAFLRYAGSPIQAAELLTWTQRQETVWIMDALCALTVGHAPRTPHDILDCWVGQQRSYHKSAAARTHRNLTRSDGVVNAATILSIALYLAAVAYELVCGGLIFRPSAAVPDVELWRTVLKIVLGTISAGTLFIASFYGKQSLPRKLSDHGKMERFYARMADQLSRSGQTETLLELLAREELIENGNWCSYQRDNTPDINL